MGDLCGIIQTIAIDDRKSLTPRKTKCVKVLYDISDHNAIAITMEVSQSREPKMINQAVWNFSSESGCFKFNRVTENDPYISKADFQNRYLNLKKIDSKVCQVCVSKQEA